MNELLKSDIELQIVQLLKNKDKASIALIYDHYAPALFGVISRIVRTKENAEEVLQDVLVKVWTKSNAYDSSKGRLFTWLLNISRNAAIDFTRSAKFKIDQKTSELDSSFVSNNARYSQTPTLNDSGLKKVLSSLDKKYQQVIELVYFQGYTQSEVEKELDIPLGTVKSRLRIALRELRAALGSEGSTLLIIFIIDCLINLN